MEKQIYISLLIVCYFILTGGIIAAAGEEEIISPVGFVEIPKAPGGEWILKSPYGSGKAWGRREVIRHLELVGREWQRRFPERPRIRIGDISKPDGGAFPPHKTHTDGLAVDIKTRPLNIVDVKFPEQRQAFELAELFYTFGATNILYGTSHKFDGLDIVGQFEGHDNHFHVEVNPAGVPKEGDWVFMPKAEISERTASGQDTIGIKLGCDLMGVEREGEYGWKCDSAEALQQIDFQLKGIKEYKTIDCPVTRSSVGAETCVELLKNSQYRWRVDITTSSGKRKRSKWFVINTPTDNSTDPTIELYNTSDTTVIPIHVTILTKNPRARKRSSYSYLNKEIMRLNEEYKKKYPQSSYSFQLESLCPVKKVAKSQSSIASLIDIKSEYEREAWRSMFKACQDFNIVDPEAINIFIYDAYSKKRGFSTRSNRVQRNSNRPYIFLDWERSLDVDYLATVLSDPEEVRLKLRGNPRLLMDGE